MARLKGSKNKVSNKDVATKAFKVSMVALVVALISIAINLI